MIWVSILEYLFIVMMIAAFVVAFIHDWRRRK